MKQKELIQFIEKSPTAYHAVAEIAKMLVAAGFTELKRGDAWAICGGGKYYTTMNGSSIVAFKIGEKSENGGYMITAAHSDSPTFKLKENAVIGVKDKYTKLNCEGYGGMICSTWLDRPLSIAGRVVVKEGETFSSRLIDFDRDLVMIPNLAIHMNRDVNDGYAFNKQIDMLPLLTGGKCDEDALKHLIADELAVQCDDICGSDLYLYNRTPASEWGLNGEFISFGRLDDLECAYTALKGFLAGDNESAIQVYACFDNEEVGSGTKQGAASTFLADVLSRINSCLGKSESDYMRALASSFMLSCDNAHALHPNHPEKSDESNCVYMNEGIVIKSHAGQKYTSDAVSIAVMKEICDRAKVPYQFFANRSDMAGGSTLGNIAMTQVSVNCVDIGLAQLAMHSAYETAGTNDVDYMILAMTQFYNSRIKCDGDSIILAK